MYAFGYGLTRDAMAWYWQQYIGDHDGSTDPDISPAALQDLRRMPRAIVITAEADILRDEARVVRAADVPRRRRHRGLLLRRA